MDLQIEDSSKSVGSYGEENSKEEDVEIQRHSVNTDDSALLGIEISPIIPRMVSLGAFSLTPKLRSASSQPTNEEKRKRGIEVSEKTPRVCSSPSTCPNRPEKRKVVQAKRVKKSAKKLKMVPMSGASLNNEGNILKIPSEHAVKPPEAGRNGQGEHDMEARGSPDASDKVRYDFIPVKDCKKTKNQPNLKIPSLMISTDISVREASSNKESVMKGCSSSQSERKGENLKNRKNKLAGLGDGVKFTETSPSQPSSPPLSIAKDCELLQSLHEEPSNDDDLDCLTMSSNKPFYSPALSGISILSSSSAGDKETTSPSSLAGLCSSAVESSHKRENTEEDVIFTSTPMHLQTDFDWEEISSVTDGASGCSELPFVPRESRFVRSSELIDSDFSQEYHYEETDPRLSRKRCLQSKWASMEMSGSDKENMDPEGERRGPNFRSSFPCEKNTFPCEKEPIPCSQPVTSCKKMLLEPRFCFSQPSSSYPEVYFPKNKKIKMECGLDYEDSKSVAEIDKKSDSETELESENSPMTSKSEYHFKRGSTIEEGFFKNFVSVSGKSLSSTY